MNSQFSITSDAVKEIDESLAEFDRARHTGNAKIVDYLLRRTHPGFAAHLTELVRIDMEHRSESGDDFSAQRYIREFADVFADPHRRTAIAFEEYRLLRRGGADVSADEIASRYEVECSGWPAVRLGQSTSTWSSTRLRSKFDLTRPDVVYPNVGEQFAGYRLVDRLGEGAYSRVFLARQPDLAERFVALKVTPLQTNESDQLARLQHSAVIPIYSVHQERDLRAICMPFLGSTTLADLAFSAKGRFSLDGQAEELVSTIVQRRTTTIRSLEDKAATDHIRETGDAGTSGEAPPLSPKLHGYQRMRYVDAIVSMVTDAVRGLAHAHEKGVVHRDLKPANILVCDDGSTVILDFNLAVDQTDPSIQVAGGTLPYMSPQQLACLDGNQDIDARDDVFSIGVVMYEMLTGTLPFSSRSPSQDIDIQSLIEQHESTPTPSRQLNPGISPGLASIISRCIAPMRENRYASAGELLEDLERHESNLPLKHVHDVALTERLHKWSKRHPRLSSASSIAAAAALLLLFCAVTIVARGRRIDMMRAESILASVESEIPAVVAELSTPGREPDLLKQGFIAAEATLGDHSIAPTFNGSWVENLQIDLLSPKDQAIVYSRLSHVAQLMSQAAADIAEQSAENNESPWTTRAAHWTGMAHQLDRFVSSDAFGATRFDNTKASISESQTIEARIASLDQSLAHDPTNVSYWFLSAVANSEAGRPERAAAGFDVCAKLQPKSLTVLFNRGLFNLSRGNNREAQQDFDACVALNPNLSIARFNRALASYRQSDFQAALTDLDSLVKSGAAGTKVLLMRARVHRAMGAHDDAVQDTKKALAMTPRDVHDWVSRGSLRLASDPSAALRDFERALAIRPGHPDALNNAAYVCSEKLDQTSKAVDYLNQLVHRRPIASSFASRGILFARLSRIDEALDDVKSALTRQPGAREKLQLAGIYALAGQKLDQNSDSSVKLSPGEARSNALQWTRLALRQDPALAFVARSDHDLSWINGDTMFQHLIDSAISLERPRQMD